MYEITVQGDYYVRNGRDRDVSSYQETFKMPAAHQALSIIQNKLINARLRSKNSNAIGFRTCQITDCKQTSGPRKSTKDVSEMSLDELIVFCLDKRLNVNPESYGSVLDARNKVQDALDNKKLADKLAAQEEQKKAKKAQEDEDLLAMNNMAGREALEKVKSSNSNYETYINVSELELPDQTLSTTDTFDEQPKPAPKKAKKRGRPRKKAKAPSKEETPEVVVTNLD